MAAAGREAIPRPGTAGRSPIDRPIGKLPEERRINYVGELVQKSEADC
jgi:hypothetical protein